MKVTQNQQIILKLSRFTEIKKALKSLTDEQDALKKDIKNTMSDMGTKVLVGGEYAACITDRVRTELDKTILAIMLGEKMKQAAIQVQYEIFEIKKA